MDVNRFQDPRRLGRCNFLRYPPKHHRHRLHFAVASTMARMDAKLRPYGTGLRVDAVLVRLRSALTR